MQDATADIDFKLLKTYPRSESWCTLACHKSVFMLVCETDSFICTSIFAIVIIAVVLLVAVAVAVASSSSSS